MRDKSAIREDILRIEYIVKEYKYNTTGQIGISEIGYGLIEKIGTKYHKAFEKECPDIGSTMTDEEVSALLGKKNVRRDSYGDPIQVEAPFPSLFKISRYGRTFDSLVKFCDGTGDKLSKSVAEICSCIERLECDIKTALGSIQDCFRDGEKSTEAEKAAAEEGIEVMTLLKEHNLADYGTCEFASVEDLVKRAIIVAKKKKKAEEERRKQADHYKKKLKEFAQSERENVNHEIMEKIDFMVNEAQDKGVVKARIQKIFDMRHPSNKAYEQMGGRTGVFKDMHTLLYSTLKDIDGLSKKIGKRKSEPNLKDEIQYNGYLDSLYPFVAKGILSEEMSFRYQPWETFVSKARVDVTSKGGNKSTASTNKKSIGLHYQGRYRLISDATSVTDYDKVSREMTKRKDEYIYPSLVVYGIDSFFNARIIASNLSAYINSRVNYFATVRIREQSDGSYQFWIEDDDSWK